MADLNTTNTGGLVYSHSQDFRDKGFLTPEETQLVWDEMTRTSLVQQLGTKVQMGANGVAVPYFEGEVTANWVEEGGKKPLTKGGFEKFTMIPHKIAGIFVMSAEVARADTFGYTSIMKNKMAEAFAVAFDVAALHGTNSPFGAFVDQTTKTVGLVGKDGKPNAYTAANDALSLLVNDDKRYTGGLLDLATEPIINSSLDNNGRPLFVEATYTETNSLTRSGRILGRPALIAEKVKDGTTLGYFGDFSKIWWGQVGTISFSVSNEATLDLSLAQDGSGLTSLWQNNLVAVLCEAEFALAVRDPESFVKVTEQSGKAAAAKPAA